MELNTTGNYRMGIVDWQLYELAHTLVLYQTLPQGGMYRDDNIRIYCPLMNHFYSLAYIFHIPKMACPEHFQLNVWR